MKKILILASVLVGMSLYAQGPGVNFSTKVGSNPSFFFTDSVGNKLTGANYSAQLLSKPVGSPDSAWAVVGAAGSDFRTGAAAGYISAGEVIIGNVNYAAAASLMACAWDEAQMGGATKADVAWLTSKPVGVAFSPVIELTMNADTSPRSIPKDLTGLLGSAALFAGVTPVIPEPSTIALALLGAGALLIRRRQ